MPGMRPFRLSVSGIFVFLLVLLLQEVSCVYDLSNGFKLKLCDHFPLNLMIRSSELRQHSALNITVPTDLLQERR